MQEHFSSQTDRDRPADLSWQAEVRLLMFVLLAITCSVLAIVLVRLWTRRRQRVTAAVAVPVAAAPDLQSEDVTADLLPSDEWMMMAGDLLNKGEFRLAMRAMFLASLAYLAYVGRLTLSRHKSNRDYCRELERKARDRAEALEAFGENVRSLERVWYGMHPATAELASAFSRNFETLRTATRPSAPTERGQPQPAGHGVKTEGGTA